MSTVACAGPCLGMQQAAIAQGRELMSRPSMHGLCRPASDDRRTCWYFAAASAASELYFSRSFSSDQMALLVRAASVRYLRRGLSRQGVSRRCTGALVVRVPYAKLAA